MANILIFWGREHHAAKLSMVCRQLEEMGHNVAIVVCDNSINIDPSTEFIYDYTNNYIHLNNFAQPDDNFGAEEDIREILLQSSLEAMGRVSPFFFLQGVIESARNVRSWQNLLGVVKPDGVIVLHSNNFFAKPLLWAARKRDIRTFAFQEGMLRHRDQHTLNKQATAFEYVDIMFTWFNQDKGAYVQAGVPEDAIIPIGPPHMDGYILSETNIASNPVTLAYFLPLLSEFGGNWQGDLVRLRKFASENNIRVIAKLHPFDYYAFDTAKNIFNGLLTDVYAGDPFALMLSSDMVATGHSTTKLEAMILNKPIVELDFDNVGILEPYHEHGMAHSATNEKELREAIENRGKYFPAVDVFRRSIRHLIDGNAALRAAQLITEILQ